MRVSSTVRSNFGLSSTKPGTKIGKIHGMKISTSSVTVQTTTVSQEMMREAQSRAGSIPSCSSSLAKSGMKAVLKAPSAKSRRNRLGKRNAAR